MSVQLPYIDRDINGTEYRAYTMNIAKWSELTELLAGVLGGPIASLLQGDMAIQSGQDVAMSRGDIQGMIGRLASKIDAKTITKLMKIMGNALHENGKPLGFQKQEIWWPSHMRDLAPVVRLFLEAQYADFYEGLSDSMPNDLSVASDQSENTNEE